MFKKTKLLTSLYFYKQFVTQPIAAPTQFSTKLQKIRQTCYLKSTCF